MKQLFHNKRAGFDYEITHTWDAGIVLLGYEVKSLKLRHGSINESIVRLTNSELRIVNMQISLYPKATDIKNYEPKRPRKLLLHKKEIAKIVSQTNKTGLSIQLLEIYIDKKGRLKAKIGIGKLRKKVEKKQILKERDVDRQAQRDIKNYV